MLKGNVSKVRFTVESNTTPATQVAIFQVNGSPVELKLQDPISLEDGDEICLAGMRKRGIFKALAYKNLSNNASGKGNSVFAVLIGAVFTTIGILTIPIAFGLFFTPIGLYCIWYGRKTSEAYKLVTSA